MPDTPPPDSAPQPPQPPPIEKKYEDPFLQKIYEKRVTTTRQRDEFMANANQQLAYLNGQIQVYDDILVESNKKEDPSSPSDSQPPVTSPSITPEPDASGYPLTPAPTSPQV